MKILVGLSGGVDSAVAAYLLKQQGLDVTCAFMRNWDSMANNDFLGNPNADDDVCPQEKDWMDAKSVADSLGLELLRVDFVKEYWDDAANLRIRRSQTPYQFVFPFQVLRLRDQHNHNLPRLKRCLLYTYDAADE